MQKPVEKPIKFVKNLLTKGKSYPITHVSAVIDDNGESIKSTIDSLKNKSSMTKVTLLELKDKRDAGKLIPGSLYRITDYQCTTTQENTQSAGHQFDIVLLALSENKLAEEGWAMMHEDIYDVTFADGVTKKCYVYLSDYVDEEEWYYNIVRLDNMLGYYDLNKQSIISIDENNKTMEVGPSSDELTTPNVTYNYFQNSNLSAWKVWYCLDNDKNRFAWADDSVSQPSVTANKPIGAQSTRVNVIYYRDESLDKVGSDGTTSNIQFYAWTTNDERIIGGNKTEYSKTLNVTTDTIFYHNVYSNQFSPLSSFQIVSVNFEQTSLGRGVIYRLIDEWDNDVPYDFKNIQFKRKLTNGQYDANGTDTWCYTLNLWYEDMCQDASILGNTLPNDEGFVTGVYDNIFGYATAYDLYIKGVNTFAFALGNNVVLSFDNDGYFGINSNTIGNGFINNTIGESFYSNTIGESFYSNTIGNGFCDNTIGNYFNDNTVGNYFKGNTVGNNFYYNNIGDNFNGNIIGNNFYNKTISDNTSYKNYGNNGVELATKS